VAVLEIAPIDEVDGSVWTGLEVYGHVAGVWREEEVVSCMEGFVGGTAALVDLVIELVAEEVVGEEVVSVGVGPVVSEIDHGADVAMSAVDCVAAGFSGTACAAVVLGCGGQVVFEVRREIGSAVGEEGGVVVIGLVPEVAVTDHVSGSAAAPEAAAMGHEQVSVAIEIEPPLIASPVREQFEFVSCWVVTPDS
jgi:hypothetical protein